jgi:uncharacterized membrane protein YfcA
VDPGPLRDALTVALGFATGVLSGLFGVGGGVISQPGMRLLGVSPIVAIGTALPAIIPGAASGTIRYSREGLIRWRAVAATVPAGLLAAVLGATAADEIPGEGHLLQLATALLLGFSAWRMRRPPNRAVPRPREEPLAESDAIDAPSGDRTFGHAPAVEAAVHGPDTTPTGTFVAIGVAAGGLSGLLGIGGGVLMVPAFVQFARMSVKTAIATSLACVGAFAVPGTITHAVQGHIDWRVAAALIVGIIPGARVGANLAITTADRRLRLVVSAFLGVTAVLYFGGELVALVD